MKQKRPHATRRMLRLPRRRPHAQPAASSGLVGRIASLARSGSSGLISLGLGTVMVALIGLLSANFVGQVMQSARLEAQRAEIQAQVDQIRAENRQLEAAVAFAESDVNVERIAREQLGYARDGDTVILPQSAAATPGPTPTPNPPAPPSAPPSAPNWMRWWGAFFPTS